MPVPQGLADVEAVADARGELLATDQVGAQHRLGLVADVAVEALDPFVLGGPRAHAERVPPLLPGRAVALGWPWPQLAAPPRERLAREPADHPRRPPAGNLGPVDSHPEWGGGCLGLRSA